MWPTVRDRVAWSVGLFVTLVSPAKRAESIEMPFGLRTWVGPRNHVLDWGSDPPWQGAILRGKDMPADLSPLAAANELVRRLRCGGIIARAEQVNLSSWGVRCGLSSNYFDHLLLCPREQRRSIVISTSQCVCPWGYLLSHTHNVYQIFCACCGLLPMAVVRSSSGKVTKSQREWSILGDCPGHSKALAIFTAAVAAAFTAKGTIQSQITSRSRRDHSVCQASANKNPERGWWECTARAKSDFYNCLVPLLAADYFIFMLKMSK